MGRRRTRCPGTTATACSMAASNTSSSRSPGGSSSQRKRPPSGVVQRVPGGHGALQGAEHGLAALAVLGPDQPPDGRRSRRSGAARPPRAARAWRCAGRGLLGDGDGRASARRGASTQPRRRPGRERLGERAEVEDDALVVERGERTAAARRGSAARRRGRPRGSGCGAAGRARPAPAGARATAWCPWGSGSRGRRR